MCVCVLLLLFILWHMHMRVCVEKDESMHLEVRAAEQRLLSLSALCLATRSLTELEVHQCSLSWLASEPLGPTYLYLPTLML